MNRQKAGVDKAKRIAEQKEALDLRKSGATYAEISDQLELSEATAWRRVQSSLKAIAKLTAKEAEVVKTLELARYDFYLRSLDPKIREGDEKAIRVAVVVSERRARLLGLDEPSKITIDDQRRREESMSKLIAAKNIEGLTRVQQGESPVAVYMDLARLPGEGDVA